MITNLVIITAYCHCAACCGKAKQPTASGIQPIAGRTVAASRTIPFGTKVYIETVGWREVHDRLAKRYDNRIDVFMNSHTDAKKFGIKKLKVIYDK